MTLAAIAALALMALSLRLAPARQRPLRAEARATARRR